MVVSKRKSTVIFALTALAASAGGYLLWLGDGLLMPKTELRDQPPSEATLEGHPLTDEDVAYLRHRAQNEAGALERISFPEPNFTGTVDVPAALLPFVHEKAEGISARSSSYVDGTTGIEIEYVANVDIASVYRDLTLVFVNRFGKPLTAHRSVYFGFLEGEDSSLALRASISLVGEGVSRVVIKSRTL